MTTANSALERVICRLTEVTHFTPRTESGNWRCPAHDDHNPSLSVSNGNRGVTLHCHAGCEVDNIVRALDLELSDLFDDPPKSNGKTEILATFGYTDESGELLFEVVRFSPKGFRQRRPGSEGWVWNLQGVRRVLYRLPDIRSAIELGEPVYITEGEKDADSIVRAGAAATCNPMGAGKWRPEHSESLRGASELYVVADKDVPGYQHARDVARGLERVGVTVSVVQAKQGKDVSDHFAAGLSLDELEEITDELDQLCADRELMPPASEVDETDEFEGGPSTNGSHGNPQVEDEDGAALALFRRWTMGELLAEPDDFAWLIRGLLAGPTYGQIAGEMKTLKSYVAGFIAVGLAAGKPIFGRFTPPSPQPVLAYVGEGGRMLWTRRIRRICQAMEVAPGDLDLHPSFDTAPLGSIVFQESLKRDLVDIEPALHLMDPLYTFHGLDSRASDLMQEGALLNKLSGPCMEAGTSSLVVNHFNQSGSGVNLKRITMAGSGEWADSWLLLAHRVDPDVAAGRFQLTLEIGSRQWGGRTWELDLDLGRFDEDLMTHVGDITWDLRPSSGNVTGKRTERAEEARFRILEALTDEPARFTKTELKGLVGGSHDVFLKVFAELADKGVITHDKAGRTEAGISKSRVVWALTPTRPDISGPSWQEDDF